MRAIPLLLVLLVFVTYESHASDMALVGARIYVSPSEPAINSGTIVIHDSHILSVGPTGTIKIPRHATVIDCKGLVVTAGFWNSHVHILLPGLLHAETKSSDELSSQLEEMLTRWGFTTVFDIASTLKNTELIRQRIEHGQVKGPRILTVGEPFWIKGGTPIYVRNFLKENDISIPEVESAEQAKARVDQQIRDGADGIKIFANSIESHEILTMPEELAKVIVDEAHKKGRPVFSHASNNKGIEVSLESGVDILAHTTAFNDPVSPALMARIVAAHMALTPTLTLWEVESEKGNASPGEIEKGMSEAAGELGDFFRAGGQVLFGTDVGYTQHFDTSDEFKWMSRAGMKFEDILASLTTNPVRRFGYATHSGRIAPGFDADLVVLAADPAQDATAFAKVRYTVREGRVIYKLN